MSDVRALLKAKRQEARIVHPLASYSASGQLRCTTCNINVKHASAWNGHIGSKAHRTNATRLKDEERQKEAWREEQSIKRKRKADEQAGDSDDDEETKRRKVQAVDSSSFLSDFFSDPSQAPLPPISDDSEDEQETKHSHATSTNHEASVLDLEWERFQRDIVNTPDRGETYERATVFADPVIAPEVHDGFPSQPDAPALAHVDAEETRRRKERDERELIMDRLLDEERAQEEADLKVIVMKERLEALKERREAAKATKKKSHSLQS